MKETGHFACDLKPGQALCLEIPKNILVDLAKRLDSESIRVTVTCITKLGRSSRLEVEAPKAVRISKP